MIILSVSTEEQEMFTVVKTKSRFSLSQFKSQYFRKANIDFILKQSENISKQLNLYLNAKWVRKTVNILGYKYIISKICMKQFLFIHLLKKKYSHSYDNLYW